MSNFTIFKIFFYNMDNMSFTYRVFYFSNINNVLRGSRIFDLPHILTAKQVAIEFSYFIYIHTLQIICYETSIYLHYLTKYQMHEKTK